MKKLLIWIFAFFIGFVSFSSAVDYVVNCPNLWGWNSNDYEVWNWDSFVVSWWVLFSNNSCWAISFYSDCSSFITEDLEGTFFYFPWSTTLYACASDSVCSDNSFFMYSIYWSCDYLWWWSSSSSDIIVYYNNWQTTSISCNWDNIITIDWLSTMSSISTFTPYFNINYTDQNNQILTESYSNNILYLSGWQYLKTYTWWSNNDWVLNLQSNWDNWFTGYLPTFNVTWNITEIDTWNVFNNFAENSLTVLLSNIPNYIQYVIMFALLLFVLWIFRKLRK